MRTATDILGQLERAGLLVYLDDVNPASDGGSISGRMRVAAIRKLEGDPRFASGVLYQLHRDVGAHLTEFRAYPGEIGDGSLQIVIDVRTGRFHADIDRFNPYADVVNAVGHAVGEVLPYLWRTLFRKRR